MRIFITGGSGTIGRAVAKAFSEEHAVTLYARDEYRMAKAAKECPRASYIIGDIRDPQLRWAMAGHDVVIHTAALKHVNLCEEHPDEAFSVNVIGSKNVFDAALNAGVKRVVAISTDKACEPSSVMGYTKALMEKMIYARRDLPTEYVAVRFGNVIPSDGSVFDIWKQQKAQGKPLTVTDPEMTRFFLPLPQAVTAINLAMDGVVAPGEIVVPEVKACRLGELVAVYGGARYGVDYIPSRPGERKNETLLTRDERMRCVTPEGFFVVTSDYYPMKQSKAVAYRSQDNLMSVDEIKQMLDENL